MKKTNKRRAVFVDTREMNLNFYSSSAFQILTVQHFLLFFFFVFKISASRTAIWHGESHLTIRQNSKHYRCEVMRLVLWPGYGIHGHAVPALIPGRGKRFIPSPNYSDRILGPPSLILRGGGGELLPLDYSNRSVKVTTHVRLSPRLRMRGFVSPLPHVFISCTETALLWRSRGDCCDSWLSVWFAVQSAVIVKRTRFMAV